MKSKNKSKETDIKNRVCFYFDNIIDGTKINFNNILINRKLYENISVYNISYKIQADLKPSRVRVNKIDGFIISLDGKIKHLA